MQSPAAWLNRTRPDGSIRPAYSFNPWRSAWRRSGAWADRNRYWDLPLRWNAEAQELGETRFVLVDAHGDFFQGPGSNPHKYRAIQEARRRMIMLSKRTHRLIWLFVTEFPENVPAILDETTHTEPPHASWWEIVSRVPKCNWWFGVRATNQTELDARVPALLKVPAVLRFAVLEPLAAPINLDGLLVHRVKCSECRGNGKQVSIRGDVSQCDLCRGKKYSLHLPGLEWIVAGGDMNRQGEPVPSHPYWFTALERQCRDAGVAYFHKNWGRYIPIAIAPEALRVGVVEIYHPATCAIIGIDGTFRRFADGTLNEGVPVDLRRHDAYIELDRHPAAAISPSDLTREFPKEPFA